MALDPSAAVTTIKDGIDAADKALDLYNKILDNVIPWKTFENTIKVLKENEKQYSDKASVLVGSITTLLLNARNEYESSVQSIVEWCGLSAPLLRAYINLFNNDYNDSKAESQRTLLVKVLGEGIVKMGAAQGRLEECSKSFNDAKGNIVKLNVQLGHDFESGSDYYNSAVDKVRKEAYAGAAVGLAGGPIGLAIAYAIAAGVVEGKLIPELERAFKDTKDKFETIKNIISDADKNIDTAKTKLKEEVSSIGDLKTKTEETKMYISDPNLQVLVRDAANQLITQCDAYVNRHRGVTA